MSKNKPESRSQKPEESSRAFSVAGKTFWVVLAFNALLPAQTTSTGPTLRFTATPANVSGPHEAIRIDLFRWSTDAERDRLLAAWTNPGAPRGRGGRGRAGAIDPNDPAFAPDPAGPQGGAG